MHSEFAEITGRKTEYSFFLKHFLNIDISPRITLKATKFSKCIHEIYMQISLPQNFDLRTSFYFMKSYQFFDIKSKLRPKSRPKSRYSCLKNNRWKICYKFLDFIIQVRMLYTINGKANTNMSFHIVYKVLLWW